MVRSQLWSGRDAGPIHGQPVAGELGDREDVPAWCEASRGVDHLLRLAVAGRGAYGDRAGAVHGDLGVALVGVAFAEQGDAGAGEGQRCARAVDLGGLDVVTEVAVAAVGVLMPGLAAR